MGRPGYLPLPGSRSERDLEAALYSIARVDAVRHLRDSLQRVVESQPGVTVEDVRRDALALPRAYEALVWGRVKFRVGSLVFLSISKDEELAGFAFPKDERRMLVESEPDKFLLPQQSDMRYHWALVRLDAIDQDELAEIVFHAWRMVVPKFLANEVAMKRGFVILDP